MILSSSEDVAPSPASRCTICDRVVVWQESCCRVWQGSRVGEFVGQLTTSTVIVAAKIVVLRCPICIRRANLLCHDVSLDDCIVNAEGDIVSVQNPVIAELM